MKKIFIALTAICAALALVSCSKEASFAAKGDVVSTTITVGTESTTKATADADGAAAAVKRCIVQVLMGDKVYETKTIEGTAGQKTYTTSIDLINGQAYTIIAWVDAGSEVYTFDEATANVTRVSTASVMDESLDAFYGSATLDLAATQNTSVSITAKRPLAQINLIATDSFKADFKPTDLVVTTKAAKTFNVLTGAFSGEETYTATSAAAYTDKTLAMTYIFAEAEKAVLDVTLGATFGTEYERTFTNIPVQQNYRTNISGKFFTVGSDITIDVDPIWGDPDYDVAIFNGEVSEVTPVDNVYTITTAAELNWVAQQVNNNTNNFSGKTVVLANDIDLCNYAWTPIGNVVSYPSISFHGIFDGQNHTIKNLNATDTTPKHATAGLFGSLTGKVKNLTIDGLTVKSNHYAGGICGFSSSNVGMEITNCSVKNGTITTTPELVDGEYDNGDKAAGIIGYMVTGDLVDGCTVENVKVTAYRDLGGIVGCAAGTVTNNTVKNSTINQDDTNGYKSSVTTFAAIIGRDEGATASNNTAENVTILSPSIAARIGSTVYASVADAISAVKEGETVEIANDVANYTGSLSKSFAYTITAAEGVSASFGNTSAGLSFQFDNGSVTFNNVTLITAKDAYHYTRNVTCNNCTLVGDFSLAGNTIFNDCTFYAPGCTENDIAKAMGTDYSAWCYGDNAVFTDCQFYANGKFLNVYTESNTAAYNVTFDGCTFTSSAANKAAVNVKETCGSTMLNYNVVISNCKAVGLFPEAATYDATSTLYVIDPLVQVDDRNVSATESGIKVTLNGSVVYPK